MTNTISARLLSATFASAALLGLAVSLPVQAQEVGNVISRTAVYQQVSVPRQVCTQTQVNVPGQTSGAGAAMGAIAGGAIGNAIGKGEGRAIATMIGVIGGAIAGDKVEGPQATQTQTQQKGFKTTFYPFSLRHKMAAVSKKNGCHHNFSVSNRMK